MKVAGLVAGSQEILADQTDFRWHWGDRTGGIGALAPAMDANETSFADVLASPEARGDAFWAYKNADGSSTDISLTQTRRIMTLRILLRNSLPERTSVLGL